jgi:hypothetical protein
MSLLGLLPPPLAPLTPDEAAGAPAASTGQGLDMATLDAAEALLHGQVRERAKKTRAGAPAVAHPSLSTILPSLPITSHL